MFVILCLLIVIIIIGLVVQGCKLWYARPILHKDTRPESIPESIQEHMGVNDNFQRPHSKYIQSSTEKKMLLREKKQINNFHRGIRDGGGSGGYNTSNAFIIDPKTGLYIPNRNYNSQEFSQQGVTTRGVVNNNYTRRNRAQQDGVGGDGVGSSGSDGIDMKKMFDDFKKNLPSGGSGSGWNMGPGSSSGTDKSGTGTPGTGTPGTGTPDGSNPFQPGTGSPPTDGSNPVSTTAGGSSSGPNTPSVTVSSGSVTNVSSNSIKKCKILLSGGIEWDHIVTNKIGFKVAIFTLLREQLGINDPKQFQPIETETTMTNYINDELTSTVSTEAFEQGTGQNAGIIINIGMYQSINISDLRTELAKISSTTEIFDKKSIGTVSLIGNCDDTKYITTATIYNKDVITIDNEVHTKDTILALIAAHTSTACPRLTPNQVFTYLSNNDDRPQLQYKPDEPSDPTSLRMNCGDKTLKSDGTFMATYPKTLEFTCGSNKKWKDASAKTILDYQTSKLQCGILIDTCSPIVINSGNNINTYIKNTYSTSITGGKYSLDTYVELACSGNFVNTATKGESSVRKKCTVGGNFVTESGVVDLLCEPKPCDFSTHDPPSGATGELKVTATNSQGAAAQKTDKFYPHGTILTYKCSTTGYAPSISSVKCEYGTWSSDRPQCVEEECKEKLVEPPDGSISLTASTKDTHKKSDGSYKQIATYKCNEKYKLHKKVNGGDITPAKVDGDDNVKICSKGLWSNQNTVYTCEPQTCSKLSIDNGTVSPNTEHGSNAVYSCNAGYKLVGNSSRKCGMGDWSGTTPTCEVNYCPDISNQHFANGTIPSHNRTQGDKVTYKCNAGYKLNSSASKTCSNGTWQGTAPTCVACSPGTYKTGSDSSTACSPCPRGSYCPGTNKGRYGRLEDHNRNNYIQPSRIMMKDINKNLLSLDDGSAARRCPRGSKCPLERMEYHQMCKLGTVQSKEGEIQCKTCPNGYESYWGVLYPDGSSDTTGNVDCRDANITAIIDMGDGVSVIDKNRTGTYNCKNPAISRTVCRPCPKGTFKQSTASTRCQECPASHYSENLGTHGSCIYHGGEAKGLQGQSSGSSWCNSHWPEGPRSRWTAGDGVATLGDADMRNDGYGKMRNRILRYCTGQDRGSMHDHHRKSCRNCW